MVIKERKMKDKVDWGKVPKATKIFSDIMLVSAIIMFVGIITMIWLPSDYIPLVFKITLSSALVGLVTRKLVQHEVYEGTSMFDDRIKVEYRSER
jgi:hypothetical protein